MKLNKKCRLCRRERVKLFLKGARCFSPKCPLEKKGAIPPGIHGFKSGFRPSSYAGQLREKQKTKRMYALSEAGFKNYLEKAKEFKGDTGQILLQHLEMRLDNVVYRLGLVPSRVTARQLVSHGHVFVNGKRLTIPSYSVKVGDEISLSEKARKMEKIQTWVARKEETPSFVKRTGFIGKMVAIPKREEISSEIDESLIVEYYSK